MEPVVGSFQQKDGYELFECSVKDSPKMEFCIFRKRRKGDHFRFDGENQHVVIVDPMSYASINIKCDVLVILADLTATRGRVTLSAKRVVVLHDKHHTEGSCEMLSKGKPVEQSNIVKMGADILELIREQMKIALDESDASSMWEQLKDVALMTKEPDIASGEREWTPSPTSDPALKLFAGLEG